MPRAAGEDRAAAPAAGRASVTRARDESASGEASAADDGSAATPDGIAYDPWSASHRRDPFGEYARLRQEAPVFWSDRMGAWIVTRYDDVVAVLMDNKRYTARGSIGIEPFTTFAPEVQAILDTGYERFPGMIELDPPDHTRYRSLVNKAFTPRRVAALEPRIQAITDDLIDGFAADFMDFGTLLC